MIKKITLGISLLFSTLMFASPAYAKWVMYEIKDGVTFHADFDNIRSSGSYVYQWQLVDYLEPQAQGMLSFKYYTQGDCEMFRFKKLSLLYHKQPMGEGAPFMTDSTPDTEWSYPPPNSPAADVLNIVCKLAENL